MSEHKLSCPHCQQELPENYGARWCSFCGKDLLAFDKSHAVEPPEPESEVRASKVDDSRSAPPLPGQDLSVSSKKKYWVYFLLAFFGPVVIATRAIMDDPKNKSDFIGPVLLIPLFVCLLVAGFSLAKISAKSTAGVVGFTILLTVVLVPVYFVVLITVAFVGCVATGNFGP